MPTYIIHCSEYELETYTNSEITIFSAEYIEGKNSMSFDKTKNSPTVKYSEH